MHAFHPIEFDVAGGAGAADPGLRAGRVQEISDRGHRVTFTWFDPPFRPEPPHCNQAYGLCFTEAGMIVLGACDGDGQRYWNLLGGGVEPGETLEDCLVREVMEEGCARCREPLHRLPAPMARSPASSASAADVTSRRGTGGSLISADHTRSARARESWTYLIAATERAFGGCLDQRRIDLPGLRVRLSSIGCRIGGG